MVLLLFIYNLIIFSIITISFLVISSKKLINKFYQKIIDNLSGVKTRNILGTLIIVKWFCYLNC